jgi:hypothetical protein
MDLFEIELHALTCEHEGKCALTITRLSKRAAFPRWADF